MAISHMQPLLLLLLVSLFLLPALVGSIEFYRCKGADKNPVQVSSLELVSQGDSTRTFTLDGYTSQNLRPGEVVAYVQSHVGSFINTRKDYTLCNVTSSCPVAPGPFIFTFKDVPFDMDDYTGEPMSDVYEVGIEYKKTQWMCIRFPFPARGESTSL